MNPDHFKCKKSQLAPGTWYEQVSCDKLVAPTPVPACFPFSVRITVTLGGITLAEFDVTVRDDFRQVMANLAGTVCGPSGDDACEIEDACCGK